MTMHYQLHCFGSCNALMQAASVRGCYQQIRCPLLPISVLRCHYKFTCQVILCNGAFKNWHSKSKCQTAWRLQCNAQPAEFSRVSQPRCSSRLLYEVCHIHRLHGTRHQYPVFAKMLKQGHLEWPICEAECGAECSSQTDQHQIIILTLLMTEPCTPDRLPWQVMMWYLWSQQGGYYLMTQDLIQSRGPVISPFRQFGWSRTALCLWESWRRRCAQNWWPRPSSRTVQICQCGECTAHGS